MTQERALQILINTAHLAQKGGLLNLDDAVVVREAILMFTKKEETPVGPKKEGKK